MEKFLKKLKTENFRLRYLKFSEFDSWNFLENYTRIKSFILDGEFEVSCNKWYQMYLRIVESLQKIRPLTNDRLLNLSPFWGRTKPFSEFNEPSYLVSNFGLYLRNPSNANDIVFAIKKMLKIYDFELENAYLVVELTPESAAKYCKQIIEDQVTELKKYLNRTFIESERFFEITIEAISELNNTLSTFVHTSYNNLFLMDFTDFKKYSSESIEKQLKKSTNKFTRNELFNSVEFLKTVKFTDGNYLNPKYKNSEETIIVDNDREIPVTFETNFCGE